MPLEILRITGQVAGIGGLALGVFLILFREIIRKNIFPRLTKQRAFILLVTIVVLVWSVGLAGIAAWVYVTNRQSPTDSETQVSLAEHIEILTSRGQTVLSKIDHEVRQLTDVLTDAGITLFTISDQTSESLGFDVELVTSVIHELADIRYEFRQLHKRHILALEGGLFTLAREIDSQILNLLWKRHRSVILRLRAGNFSEEALVTQGKFSEEAAVYWDGIGPVSVAGKEIRVFGRLYEDYPSTARVEPSSGTP